MDPNDKVARRLQGSMLDQLLRLISYLPVRPPSFPELPEAPDVGREVRDFVFSPDATPSWSSFERYAWLVEGKKVVEALKEHSGSLVTLTRVATTMYWRKGPDGKITVNPGRLVQALDGID